MGKSRTKSDEHPSGKTVVVAIGASAGGLKAYEQFFKAAPASPGVAFVLIPHLDPSRHSMMADLVGKYTKMRVAEAPDGAQVKPDHVYIIPPNKYLSIKNGRLSLEKPIELRGVRMAIDFFFRSLAESERERAIGIVLSGTATDGTQGLKSIKENGGMAMVQDPLTAQHDSMPRSAINTGMVDFILPPEKMPDTLLRYVQHNYVRGAAQPDSEDAPKIREQVDEIEKALAVIHARTGRDFRVYKRGTINRRVQRRMGLRQIFEMKDYIELLRNDEAEVRMLFDDLLIGVTQFYRDPDAWSVLESEVIQELVKRDRKGSLRIWVPGCSTGEEAFSIAISFMDVAAKLGKHISLQVFATDIDERALAFGRNALYPESIVGDLSADRLSRYFSKEDHSFRVNKHVRETVVFACQDLIHDPPFSRLDLISCRNLLIYLEADIQHKILSLFRFALNDDGYMFLGSSETVGRMDKAYEAINKKHRLFKKSHLSDTMERPPFPIIPGKEGPQLVTTREPARTDTRQRLGDLIRIELLEGFAPASVVVTEKCEVIFNWGTTGEYLQLPDGELTNDLLALARHGLRVKLRQLIRDVFKDGNPTSVTARPTGGEDIRISARLIRNPMLDAPLCLVCFIPAEQAAETETETEPDPEHPGEPPGEELGTDADDALVSQLEGELRSIREELHGTIEELESSNEELKTANEEAMSMNEELSTVNAELQEKLELLEKANNDLNNLLASTDIATIFLDEQGVIRRFTPSARQLFKLIISDVGRPLNDITHNIRGDLDLVADAIRVIERLEPLEDEIEDEDGNWYIRRVAPYRTEDNRIDGAVLTFSDVSRVKQAEASMRESEARYRALYENNPAMCFTLDAEFCILSVNALGAEQLNSKRTSLVGRNFIDLHADERTVAVALQSALSAEEVRNEQWEARMIKGPDEVCWARGLARRAMQDGQDVIFVTAQDITLEKRLTDQVYYHATHDYLTGLLNRREFDVLLRRIFDTARVNRSENALIYIDLARFKLVNDTAGHGAGDEVLMQVGEMLRNRSRARQRDVVARLGGDEFGVILESCPMEDAERIAHEISGSLRDSEIEVQGHRFDIDSYIGVVSLNSSSSSIEEVLRHADAACYEAKSRGAGQVHVFDPGRDTKARKQSEIAWAKIIRNALENDSFSLVCEPIVSGPKRTPVGYELLIRVREDDQLLDTSALISAAERYGMAAEIDLHVVKLALHELSVQLPRLGELELFSINISGQSVSTDGFVPEVSQLVNDSKVPAKKLCFEITETAAIENLNAAKNFISSVRSLGCKVALDDFGSGLSSIHYLKHLPCDLLKIDGGFIRDILIDESDRSLVAAIHNIAQLLGLKTVAEYVENDRVDDVIRSIGVDYRQGYCFGESATLAETLSRS